MVIIITRKILGAFMVDEFYLKPFSSTLSLSHSVHHTRFPTRKKTLQLGKPAIRAPAAALGVNAAAKAVAEKLVVLSVTALVTLRNSEVENIQEMMPSLLDALNPPQRLVLQLVSTEIDPSKTFFTFFFLSVGYH
jgi:hypothetical protein